MIAAFEELARDMVGDGKRPDVFFISLEGKIHTMTLDFKAAYDLWQQITQQDRTKETALENRTFGVISSNAAEEGSSRLQIIDSSREFLSTKRRRKKGE